MSHSRAGGDGSSLACERWLNGGAQGTGCSTQGVTNAGCGPLRPLSSPPLVCQKSGQKPRGDPPGPNADLAPPQAEGVKAEPFENHSALEIAEQLTLLDHLIFKKIPYE